VHTNKNDRTEKLLREILLKLIETKEASMDKFIEKLSKKYDVYLKSQDNEFKDE